MGAILTIIASFWAKAIIIGGVMGILTKCGNIFIRAVTGKEEFL